MGVEHPHAPHGMSADVREAVCSYVPAMAHRRAWREDVSFLCHARTVRSYMYVYFTDMYCGFFAAYAKAICRKVEIVLH